MNNSSLFDNTSFYESFRKDLSKAYELVVIESPFITTRRVENLMPIIRRLRKRDVRVIINTRPPEEHDEAYAFQAENAISSMQSIGVKVLYTIRHHRKVAIVDDILWEGSLNILSHSDSCEIMRRTVSSVLTNEMMRFTGVANYVA